MKCNVTNNELETVVNRIQKKRINLQPEYQRGEVWSETKKKKLIDTIIRDWKIPPIHLVVDEVTAKTEVLDGQQRLVAIRDFCANDFSIDGYIEPIDENIKILDGLYFDQLPGDVKERINSYDITFINLTDYSPEEPAELFNRLNQPSTLTAAEKRNAYIGETRRQIKTLVDDFEEMGASKELIGFSNSRLAYDEVISKFAYMIETNTMKKKVTALDISKRYQEDIIFNQSTIEDVSVTLERFINAIKEIHDKHLFHPKFSKATIISWLIYVIKNERLSNDSLTEIIFRFESSRDFLKNKISDNLVDQYASHISALQNKYPFLETLLNIYNQRASMGSTDAVSIIYRDIIIHVYANMICGGNADVLHDALIAYANKKSINHVIESINEKYDWGVYIK